MGMAKPNRTVSKTSAGFGVIKTGAKKSTKLAVELPAAPRRASAPLRAAYRTA